MHLSQRLLIAAKGEKVVGTRNSSQPQSCRRLVKLGCTHVGELEVQCHVQRLEPRCPPQCQLTQDRREGVVAVLPSRGPGLNTPVRWGGRGESGHYSLSTCLLAEGCIPQGQLFRGWCGRRPATTGHGHSASGAQWRVAGWGAGWYQEARRH